jgi:hypoxanthine phosphoribosyltransferase
MSSNTPAHHLPNVSAGLDVLIDEATLQARIAELGKQIERDYAGKPLVLVGVLKGSLPFMADLARRIDLPLHMDFLGLSSYGDKTESSGVVRITSDLSKPIEGKDVVVVEDIVDTGLTMSFLLQNLATRKPASVRICTLLHKPARSKVQVPLDYVGFTIEDKFVVGYGLDYAEKLRNVPFVGVVRNP